MQSLDHVFSKKKLLKLCNFLARFCVVAIKLQESYVSSNVRWMINYLK